MEFNTDIYFIWRSIGSISSLYFIWNISFEIYLRMKVHAKFHTKSHRKILYEILHEIYLHLEFHVRFLRKWQTKILILLKISNQIRNFPWKKILHCNFHWNFIAIFVVTKGFRVKIIISYGNSYENLQFIWIFTWNVWLEISFEWASGSAL